MGRDMPELTVSAQRLLTLMRGYRELGGPPPDQGLLAALGMSEAQLETSTERFPVRFVSLAAEAASRELNDPVLGLSMAARINAGERAFLVEMARNAGTLAEFVALLSRYTCIYTEIATFDIVHEAEGLSFVAFSSPVEDQISRHQVEGAVYLMREAMLLFCGRQPERVSLRHALPAGVDSRVRQLFGCPLDTGAPRSGLYVRTTALFVPHDNGVGRRHLAHFERQRGQLRSESLTDRVAFMIRRSLVHGEPGRETVAADLCMSVRTLQRSLSAEGTTFREVLEKTRSELARFYLLESPFSNAQVSVLLGYSESSQFYQAFRRWFSCSPGEFRLWYHARSSSQPSTDP